MDFTIETDSPSRCVLRCPTQLHWQARLDMVGALTQAAPQDVTEVILDLHGVEFMNSAGLAAIFLLHRHLKSSGARLVICRAAPMISRLLTTVNLPALMPVVRGLDDARALLAGTTLTSASKSVS